MITNELLTYIENEVNKGTAHGVIMEALVTAGWQRMEIAEAFRMIAERASPDKAGSPMIEMPIAVGLPKEATNIDLKIEPTVVEVKTPEVFSKEIKPEHHRLIPILIVFGLVVFGVGGYFLLGPLLNSPNKKISRIVGVVENLKSIQYSGDYEITAPAGMVLTDKVLVSTFGGIDSRQVPATIKGTFLGVDDWFDSRAKKNEVKFTNKISVQGNKSMDFSATSRLISNAFYAKLSESSTVFDNTISNQGANWIRYDGEMNIPTFAYGFFGKTSLYDKGFARELASFLSDAIPGNSTNLPTGETIVTVRYADSIATYFSNIFLMSDRLEMSANIGSKFTFTAITELPTGEITFDQNDLIKKAVISFAYKTKEYSLPVRVRFTISYDHFDLSPTINIPPLVVSYSELENKNAATDLPEVLKSFFSDIRTVAGVFKGTNNNSFKGVCQKSGVEGETGTELTIPFISAKILASGFDNPICFDTATAWSLYTHNTTGYYCTDSRGFSGKANKQPLGDKCN